MLIEDRKFGSMSWAIWVLNDCIVQDFFVKIGISRIFKAQWDERSVTKRPADESACMHFKFLTSHFAIFSYHACNLLQTSC